MPKLPEVETVRAYIDRCVSGQYIKNIEIFLPRLIKNATAEEFAAALTGQMIQSVRRRGKYLRVQCSGTVSLLVHLRMTGSLLYEEPCRDVPARRILFRLSKGCLTYRDIRTLGCLWLVPSQGKTGISGYDSLGPDGTSPEFTVPYLQAALKGSHRKIKAFLLDQTAVAGLGNIYVDEALFQAHIRPSRRCDRISRRDSERLHDAVVQVLRTGLENGGTTIRDFINGRGSAGHNQDFLCVYGREGKPCPVCGEPIKYVKLAGRGTRYCPHCQK